jgi:hypothetical protein
LTRRSFGLIGHQLVHHIGFESVHGVLLSARGREGFIGA